MEKKEETSEKTTLSDLETALEAYELNTIFTDENFEFLCYFDRTAIKQTGEKGKKVDSIFKHGNYLQDDLKGIKFATINWDLSSPEKKYYSHCCVLIFDFEKSPVDVEFYDPRGKDNQQYGGRETCMKLINRVLKNINLERRMVGNQPIKFEIDYMEEFGDFYSYLDENLNSTEKCRYETFKYIYGRIMYKKKGYDNEEVVTRNKESITNFVNSDKDEDKLSLYVPEAIKKDIKEQKAQEEEEARKLNEEFAGLDDSDYHPIPGDPNPDNRKLRFF